MAVDSACGGPQTDDKWSDFSMPLQREMTTRLHDLVTVSDNDSRLQPRKWSERGQHATHDHFGAAYCDAADMQTYPNATRIGVGYMISAFGPVEPTTETFLLSLELSLLYKVQVEDVPVLMEHAKKRASLQEIADAGDVRTPPPIFELTNAHSCENYSSRIVSVTLMHQPDKAREANGGWHWYAKVYISVRATCYEALEYQNFPFSRQAFQVKLTMKLPISTQLPVPYNCAQPPFVHQKALDGDGYEVAPNILRRNLYKHSSPQVGCWRLASHCIMFNPSRNLPRMPSSHRYASMVIALCAASVLGPSPNSRPPHRAREPSHMTRGHAIRLRRHGSRCSEPEPESEPESDPNPNLNPDPDPNPSPNTLNLTSMP